MDREAGREMSTRQRLVLVMVKRTDLGQTWSYMNKHWPEVEVFEGEVCLDDACGLDSGPQDVLLCWLVVCRTNTI